MADTSDASVELTPELRLDSICPRCPDQDLGGRIRCRWHIGTHPLANKGVALTELAKLLAIPLAEIAVIGDGGNDVAMFERSGLSIAMGNASPEVKRTADFVTNSRCDRAFCSRWSACKRARRSPAKSRPLLIVPHWLLFVSFAKARNEGGIDLLF
jgi:hypothetical protein